LFEDIAIVKIRNLGQMKAKIYKRAMNGDWKNLK
jgi:hypothetical protein